MMERAGGIDKIVRGLPSEDVLTEKCQIFAALSSSVRLRIMYILAGADLCPSAIKVLTGMSESRISYHMDILEGAGLVKHGPWRRWRIYSLTEEGRAFMYASESSDANAI
ncbi:ArsR/SmtB family transcription factor [Methanomethylophilus alvi]|uniref:ArsR/SmtB family transcription factor n=1 Tax=Methanomethylophilus alvi TaxID=1291540 RepID=UPI0037DD2953